MYIYICDCFWIQNSCRRLSQSSSINRKSSILLQNKISTPSMNTLHETKVSKIRDKNSGVWLLVSIRNKPVYNRIFLQSTKQNTEISHGTQSNIREFWGNPQDFFIWDPEMRWEFRLSATVRVITGNLGSLSPLAQKELFGEYKTRSI